MPSGASEQEIASLGDQGSGGVNPAVVQGRVVFLPGEISPHVRTDDAARAAEREVSRGRSSRSFTGNEGPNDEKSATDVSLGSKRPQMSRADGSSPEGQRG